MASFSLGEIAKQCGGRVVGDSTTQIDGIGTLIAAGPRQIAFLSNPRYRKYLADTGAGVVILAESDVAACPAAALVADDPYVLYARVAGLFAPSTDLAPGIHAGACVEEGADIHADASVAAGAIIATGARIGARVRIGAGCYIGPGVEIGEDTRLEANVTVQARVRIGRNCLLHPGVVVGADGFGIARAPKGWIKVPQLGSVVIGDDVEVGANTTIDRGALEDTVIEDGVKLDNQIQVAHNVRIGARTAIAGCTAIAGTAVIGRDCLIGGGVGIGGHIQIADKVVITAKSMVPHSIREPGMYSNGVLPLETAQEWRKNGARFRHLDALARQVRELKKKLKDLGK